MPENSRIIKFRKYIRFNVGTLIFVMIAAYFIFGGYKYLHTNKVNFYEVRSGSIVKEHYFTGLILRSESIELSGDSGYVNYFAPDGKKVGVGSPVYSIDQTGRFRDYIASHPEFGGEPDQSACSELKQLLKTETAAYRDITFSDCYASLPQIRNIITDSADISMLSTLQSLLSEQGIEFKTCNSSKAGTVSYYIDGFEETEPEKVTEGMFDRNSYKRTQFQSSESTEAGKPVYKVITSENWKLVFPLTQEDIADFGDTGSLIVRFQEYGIKKEVPFKLIIGGDGQSYGLLSFNKYMVQFLQQRLIDFEIIRNEATGLKIPNKSITEKEFFRIPAAYYQKAPDGNYSGVYQVVIGDSGTTVKFVELSPTYANGEYCYISCDDESIPLKAGDRLALSGEDRSEYYEIGPKEKLKGVYNINKGYVVFQYVDINEKESSEEYSIITRENGYGPSVYDHIVLDASTVTDGELLYN